MLDEALGDLAPKVELVASHDDPSDRVADRHAAVGLARPGHAGVLRGLEDRAVHDGRRHRRPVLPPARHDVVRLRAVLARDLSLRGLRRDVPRRRRAHRRRVARASAPTMWEALVRGPARLIDDPGGVLRLRRRDPLEPVRGVQRLRGAHTASRATSSARINATNPDTNAWARFERSEVAFDEFCDLFEAECRAPGHEVAARELMPLLAGEIRPAMVEAVRRCRERLVTACLTNNWVSFDDLPADARAERPRRRARRCSTTSSSRARSACASPTRASTSWPARLRRRAARGACSSTTSA